MTRNRIGIKRIIASVLIVVGLAWAHPTEAAALSNTAAASAAQNGIITANVQNQQASSATLYKYKQLSMSDAYIYFTSASFIGLAGLILYGSSYLIKQDVQRSQYVSRYYDYAKTTY